MVKKLQAKLAKAKAKKGFTLVELIVVIAIIAVLAAILIPTLTSQLQKSQVTSADTTARKMCDFVNQYITDYVTAGGAYASGEAEHQIKVTPDAITYDGVFDSSSKAWTKAGAFDDRLKEEFNLKSTSKAMIFIDKGGKAYAAVYTESAFEPAAANFSKSDDGLVEGHITWKDVKHEGVTSDGYVVGTFPKIEADAE